MEHQKSKDLKYAEEIDRIYRKLNEFTDKSIEELTKDEIDAFVNSIIEGKSCNTIRLYVILMNKILLAQGIDIQLSLEDYVVEQEVKYIDKKELYKLVDYLDSYQDAFILVAIYHGIAGKQMIDLRELTTSQVDLNNKTITVGERVIHMDDKFFEITDMAMHQQFGCAISANGVYSSNGEFTYNLKSKYVLKVRQYKNNRQGLDPMSYNGFRTRVRSIMKYLNLDMTVNELEKSGYLYRLKQKSDKWTFMDMKHFLKAMHIPCEVYNMLRLFENTFNK